jgi:peptidoglycan/xylan/chitin deacetylase (PgdA/CDA1 family)
MFDLTLTFDNGPDPETTPRVLDVLALRSIRSTFFVVGNKLSTPEGRGLARRAHEEGHWIGNHTWSH